MSFEIYLRYPDKLNAAIKDSSYSPEKREVIWEMCRVMDKTNDIEFYTRLYCKAHNRFRDNILSDKEQTARRAVARRGFATQYDEMLAERYVRLAIEGSI